MCQNKLVPCFSSYLLDSRPGDSATSLQIPNKIQTWLRLIIIETVLFTYLPDRLIYVCLMILYRTMPFGYASVAWCFYNLSVEANNPPLSRRRRKLSLQYALRLSSNYQNPAYNVVFNAKFGRSFQNKPNQIPSLGICDLHEVGFRKKKFHQILTNCCVSALSQSCWNFNCNFPKLQILDIPGYCTDPSIAQLRQTVQLQQHWNTNELGELVGFIVPVNTL